VTAVGPDAAAGADPAVGASARGAGAGPAAGAEPAAGVEPAIVFSLQGVSRRFGHVVAVDDVWLDVREGEFFSLLGPSGCGKTTTLRILAGFEIPDAGRVLLRGQDVTTTPPERRDTNLVFQHYELFPHMTVAQNVGYGLRLRKVREPELGRRVTEALRIVRTEELADRSARHLSGGQMQRVALARALVNRPAVLLLDEPLSALDVKLRKQMQLELKQIQETVGTTFVYVTHDQEEALLLSDRIGVMHAGRLLQVATPRELYERPAEAFVADFVGSLNVLPGRVAEVRDGVAVLQPLGIEAGPVTPRMTVAAPGTAGPMLAPGDVVRVAIRPERVAVAPMSADPGVADPRATTLAGTVEQVVYLGAVTQLIVTTAGGPPVVVQQTSDDRSAGMTRGSRVILCWQPDAAFVLPDDGLERG
jgi:spermidine/putrescine transport system ATP-binding protein